MEIKLRLVADVDYVVDAENPTAEVELLKHRLRRIAEEAFENGVVTDDLQAYVEDYRTSAVQLS